MNRKQFSTVIVLFIALIIFVTGCQREPVITQQPQRLGYELVAMPGSTFKQSEMFLVDKDNGLVWQYMTGSGRINFVKIDRVPY
ncbi:MAG: hypothetical protein P4L35_16020 [Ignavibacteriaceae bacterium]|nr:hypothetical protein [Ignavibacteriaceae bacterium]